MTSSFSAVKSLEGQADNTIGPLNDIADHKTLLVCQMPALIHKGATDNYNDDATIPRCLGEYFSLLLIFMVTTLVLIVTLCILIVIAIFWCTARAQSCPK